MGPVLRVLARREDARIGGPRQHCTPLGRRHPPAGGSAEGTSQAYPLCHVLAQRKDGGDRRHGRRREALGHPEPAAPAIRRCDTGAVNQQNCEQTVGGARWTTTPWID